MEYTRLQPERGNNEPANGSQQSKRPRIGVNSSRPLTLQDGRPGPRLTPEHNSLPFLQAKLTVNQPGDQYEQEADRVAEQVMRMPEPALRLQRKCGCGGSTASGGSCEECVSPSVQLQRRATPGHTSSASTPPSIVHDVLRSSGQALDPSTRAFMETRFGHDFSQVRVHTDSRAADSARAVNALAYTVGANMTFNTGQYAPGTLVGRRLLAHELAHVVQQQQCPTTPGLQSSLTISQADDAAEIEADAVAERVVAEQEVSSTLSARAAGLQRTVNVPISSSNEAGARACLVHLHGDEENAFQTAQGIHADFCSNFARLVSSTRCVDVGISGRNCTADPNRIFSDEAIDDGHPFTGECGCERAARPAARTELKRYRRQLENAIGQCRGGGGSGIDGPLPVAAFHNNTPHGGLSINSYLPGGAERRAVGTRRLPRTTLNPSRLSGTGPDPDQLRDPDNFLLVSDPRDFTALRNRFNIVLQDTTPETARPRFDDGSLSVRLRNQRFINVEAQVKPFSGTSDPSFITNRHIADEVMAHMGVPRRRAAGVSCAAPSPAAGAGGVVLRKPSAASAPVQVSVRGATQVLARQGVGRGRPSVELPREQQPSASPQGTETQERPRIGQPRTPQPRPAPAPPPTQCITDACRTFRDIGDLRPIKTCWRGIIDTMARANRVGVANWFIGIRNPPAAVRDEVTLQRDCMLDALRSAAGAPGSGITVPSTPPGRHYSAPEWRRSDYRGFTRQLDIWRQKFLFTFSDEFDRITANARRICGPTLLPASETKWNPRNTRHRICWRIDPMPTPPPSGAIGRLTDVERQQEILEASSAPGISRHHWGTDFDLFDLDPEHWRRPPPPPPSIPTHPSGSGTPPDAGGGTPARPTPPAPAAPNYFATYEWLAGRPAVRRTPSGPGHAAQYGFMQTFTATSRHGMGYMEEQWHWSYYPVAQALLEWFRDSARTPTPPGTVPETNRQVVGRLLTGHWTTPPPAGSPPGTPPTTLPPFTFIRPNWEAFVEHVNQTPQF